jgi:hypothetical protein
VSHGTDINPPIELRADATANAIEKLKRLGKTEWGASYYSQLAPIELCERAARPRRVQYGALISWLKRLQESSRPAPVGAIALVAHLTETAPEDCTTTSKETGKEAPFRRRSGLERRGARVARFEVNCPSVVHDSRFVVVGELPDDDLYAAVLVQPLDGTGFWYPQIGRHNPLRAGRAFACFVQLGNPAGIWHVKRPPLDAKVRVLALRKAWSEDWAARVPEEELMRRVAELGVLDQKDSLTSRVSTDPLEPSLRDCAAYCEQPLVHDEPRARSCVAPLTLDWRGGAAYVEIRKGDGDQQIFQGTAAPGAVLSLRNSGKSAPPTSVLFELPEPGRYRLRLYPAVKSFVNPPYEWWLDIG